MSERITNNYNPTPDDIREWGYDEDLYFMEQDEDLLLYGLGYVPVLLELAQDPACPKQDYALWILGQFARESALYRRSEQLEGLQKVVVLLQTSQPSVQDWRNYVDRLLAYQAPPFAVNEQKAWIMAQDLLVGIGRVGQINRVTEQPSDVWCFSLITSIHEQLSITKRTGVYTYQRLV
ncbi:MAG: hypothetical protein F6K32_15880 [Desertifilum sp. SIO1I2]|nr:hypothetical protein [Desertifilum sp. SIO1I2]